MCKWPSWPFGKIGNVRRPRGPALRLMICILACNMKTLETTSNGCNGDKDTAVIMTMILC